MKYQGFVRKLKTALKENGLVQYQLPFYTDTDRNVELVELNSLIGRDIKIENLGHINCISCGRKTKKSFAQGYCYPCFTSLPQCDSCIMSPEKCHYQAGTCRDSQWGKDNCLIPHYVYLARSSSVKVGITRGTQIPTRWMDQGAIQALPIVKVSQRYYSGLMEVIFKEHVSDRTSWQKMLKGEVSEADLYQTREQLFNLCQQSITNLLDEQQIKPEDIELLNQETIIDINYPVEQYPAKVKSFNLDKLATAEGQLMGIKGQYLILDTGVINIRKYTAYQLGFSIS
ncbi:MAG: DUF2797 domain-containing protein [Gammaproteobacteria bacterium]|nr:DUF2797 domain-containing protein [Gammaproteobacteria bacterium]